MIPVPTIEINDFMLCIGRDHPELCACVPKYCVAALRQTKGIIGDKITPQLFARVRAELRRILNEAEGEGRILQAFDGRWHHEICCSR